MSYLDDKAKGTFSATNVGTSSGVSATKTAPSDTNRQYVVTDISASGDGAAIVTVESPANTVLWNQRFAAAFAFSARFETPLPAAIGQAVLVKVSASTTHSEANIGGFTV